MLVAVSPKTCTERKKLKKPCCDVYSHISHLKCCVNCINVTVGITRSKIFFLVALACFGCVTDSKDSVDAGPKTSPGIFLQALIRSGAFYSFKWCYTLCLHNGCSIAPENKKTRSKSQESQSHKSDKSKTETKKRHKEVGLYMHIWFHIYAS